MGTPFSEQAYNLKHIDKDIGAPGDNQEINLGPMSFMCIEINLSRWVNLVSYAVGNKRIFSFQVENYQESGNISAIIDQRLGNSFTTEGMEEFMQLTVRCMDPSSERRPTMSYVVTELDRILEKEMSLTTIMGEGTPVVTLGSQLFRASK